jgi:hypothetical protein
VAPRLAELVLGDEPAGWSALGFAVDGGLLELGGVTLRLEGGGGGIRAWRLEGRADGGGPVDGLAAAAAAGAPAPAAVSAGRPHPNGALALDHVVIATPDLDRTIAALERAGLELRRIRETSSGQAPLRQAFFVAGTCVLEVAGPPEPAGDGPASFWGLTVVVGDLEALAERLGPRLGPTRPAVQAGRRIATLRSEAGLGTAVAFMTPRPPS